MTLATTTAVGVRRRPATAALLALAVLSGLLVSRASAAPVRTPDERVAVLPAPFDGWAVTLQAAPSNPQRLTLAFDSAVLGRRVENVVWVPDSYGDHPAPRSGVVYYLHGTTNIDAQPANPVLRVFDPPKGGYYAGAHRFDTRLDRQRYLVVVLDTGAQHWCPSCWWVDGRNGQGVAAETHLHRELIPLVEALFHTRTDRGGRGVLGHSMGGSGALIQGFRHPDRFAFIGATGATIASWLWQPVNDRVQGRWTMYLRGQGYEAADEIGLRNIDPLDLAPHMVGTGAQIVMALGDGCDRGDESCQLPPEVPRAALIDDNEGRYRLYSEAASAMLAETGLPHLFLKRDGTHVGLIADTYARHMVDRINRTFAAPAAEPETFSYKTADRSFGVWGYDVTVRRPNTEFLNLLGARRDGRELTLAGTGEVDLVLPAAFAPGATYRVLVTREDATITERLLAAGADGRLRLTLELAPGRGTDERRALVEAGQFLFPHTRVEVLAEPGGPSPA